VAAIALSENTDPVRTVDRARPCVRGRKRALSPQPREALGKIVMRSAGLGLALAAGLVGAITAPRRATCWRVFDRESACRRDELLDGVGAPSPKKRRQERNWCALLYNRWRAAVSVATPLP
jgi:hypothetical protein